MAILIREELDVRAIMREAKHLRAALERTIAFRKDQGPAEVRTPFALLIILPQTLLAGLPFSEDKLLRLVRRRGDLSCVSDRD